jgi:hypothetical protein
MQARGRRRAVDTLHVSQRRLRRRTSPTVASPTGRKRDWPTLLGVLAAVIAAVGALIFNGISATATNEQIELSRLGQITDRYSAAVEQLGSNSVEVRIGGIYALEQVMRDSQDDQPTVVEVLAAFVRSRDARRPSPSPHPTIAALPGVRTNREPRPADLVAALTALGRRNLQRDRPGQMADLKYANLDGLDLTGIELRRVDLSGTSLRGSVLVGAEISDSWLFAADLTDARVSLADLSCSLMVGANLTRADLSNSNLTRVGLVDAILDGTNLTGVILNDAPGRSHVDFSKASGSPHPDTTASPRLCSNR